MLTKAFETSSIATFQRMDGMIFLSSFCRLERSPFNFIFFIATMSRASLDTSRLPRDVLTYTNKRFFDFIQSFCGKDEADLLAIQSIRSVDSFLSVEDVYSIFSLDSEDLDAIQKRCGFRNRNGLCTVRSGIKSSLDYVHDLLKKKQKEAARVKKSPATLRTSTDVPSPIDVSLPSNDDSSITIRPGKTEAEHRENINKCIEEWCLQNKSDFGVDNFDFASDLTYELRISSSLDKGEIKCSCGLSASLFLGESGNFKVR